MWLCGLVCVLLLVIQMPHQSGSTCYASKGGGAAAAAAAAAA